tara:strand:+ start:4641 stop:4994 length:354 start_codon:yes stop_codon:yes gene_type:complete
MKEKFEDNTFSLIKALHHTKIAMDYFDDVAKNYEYGAKQIMLNYAAKCKWIIDNIRHRLPQDAVLEIDSDIRDALFLDAIEDKLIHFTDSQKSQIEDIVDLMSKGELIEITDNKNPQ